MRMGQTVSTGSPVQTHICLCPCECSHLEPLCMHTSIHKHTHLMSNVDDFVYEPVLCKLKYNMYVPLRSAHSKNLVSKKNLTPGFEMCRFGWVLSVESEHFGQNTVPSQCLLL